MTRVAINGLGRIGRAALKIILDTPELEFAAANDLVSTDNLAYVLKYDSIYGRYEKKVEAGDNSLIIDGKEYRIFNEKDPSHLPWRDLGVDLVFECTGVFTRRKDMEKHIQAGAKRVILSAPSKDENVGTIVYSVNRMEDAFQKVISCASCTTNCITPVVEVMGRRIGIRKAIMTTVHAYTSTQALVDSPYKKARGRAAAVNFVPTTTGAAIATTRALPQYKGKFNGVAIRGPVAVGSIADIVFITGRHTSVQEINSIFKEEAATDRYKGVLGASEDPLVSSDIIKDPRASIVDLTMTQVVDGDLAKVMSWYDNEWGYATQMIREAIAW